MKRNKNIARIARQQDDGPAGPFPLRDEILAAEFVPTVGLGPLLEKIVGIDNVRHALVLLRLEAKGLPDFFAKIGAEKSADPGAAALGNGNDKRVAAGKLARAAAQVPPNESLHGRVITLFFCTARARRNR